MTQASYIPRMLIEATDTTSVVEESSFTITSSATGTVSQSLLMNLSNLSAYSTQWLTIYDEWRLNQVQFRWHSRVGTNTNGSLVMYIERDQTDAAATTLVEGYRQQESQEFRPYDDFVTSPKLTTLQWKPKDPQDHEYVATNGNSIFRLVIVGENLPVSTVVGSVQTFARIQFRGRN